MTAVFSSSVTRTVACGSPPAGRSIRVRPRRMPSYARSGRDRPAGDAQAPLRRVRRPGVPRAVCQRGRGVVRDGDLRVRSDGRRAAPGPGRGARGPLLRGFRATVRESLPLGKGRPPGPHRDRAAELDPARDVEAARAVRLIQCTFEFEEPGSPTPTT